MVKIAHIGYFVAFTKIADFLRAGAEASNLHPQMNSEFDVK
jgi:hypothetical protein